MLVVDMPAAAQEHRVYDDYLADLAGTSLRLTNCTGARFAGANLTDADFFDANLQGADLHGYDETLVQT